MSVAGRARLRLSMRIAMPLLLPALVALAMACGGGSSTTPTATSAAAGLETSTTGSTPTPEPTAQALIDNALLDVPDMPAGWQSAFAAAGSLDLTLNLCNRHIDDGGYVAHGQTAVSAGQEALLEQIAVYPSGRAAAVLNNIRSAFGACSQWTATRGNQSLTFHAAQQAFPTLGDETLAFTMAASGPGNAAAGSQVYVVVRQGATVMTVSYLTAGAVDATGVQNLVRGAFDKLQKVQTAGTS